MKVVVLFFVVVFSTTAYAGEIVTSQSAFDAAVSSLDVAWTEDFEGFAADYVPNTLSIGGGGGEVHGSPSSNMIRSYGSLIGEDQVYLKAGSSSGLLSITGGGGSGLGVYALAITTYVQVAQPIEFRYSSGVDMTSIIASHTPTFIGWIGTDPLESIHFTESAGVIVDSINAFSNNASTPEPASLGVFAMLFGGVLWRRRRAA